MASGENDDFWDGSDRESFSFTSVEESDRDDDIDEIGELKNLVQIDDRIEWIERKVSYFTFFNTLTKYI